MRCLSTSLVEEKVVTLGAVFNGAALVSVLLQFLKVSKTRAVIKMGEVTQVLRAHSDMTKYVVFHIPFCKFPHCVQGGKINQKFEVGRIFLWRG